MNKIIAVIPARYQSSRFPGKPLALIKGKPMIQWVYERVTEVEELIDVYVATDDVRIKDVVEAFGGKDIMTGECSCGTDRVYIASKDVDCDIVVNIQGDEPLIKKEMVQKLIEAFDDQNVKMATLKKSIIDQKEIDDSNVVKVITDKNDDAIYFSRYPIPFNRDAKEVNYYKHIGMYAYRKDFLKKIVDCEQTQYEKIESLEQLRVIENGYKIRVKETDFQSIGIDTPSQIELAEKLMDEKEDI